MATEGIEGYYVMTRNYGATASFWRSLGFAAQFETDHGSGQWVHPGGGPYVFIDEQPEGELETHPILRVADSTTFAPDRAVDYKQPFTPEHWGVAQAMSATDWRTSASCAAPRAPTPTPTPPRESTATDPSRARPDVGTSAPAVVDQPPDVGP